MNDFLPPEFRSVALACEVAAIIVFVTSVIRYSFPALGIAISFLLGFFIITDWNVQLFPIEGWRWIVWVGVAAIWGSLCDLLIGSHRNARLLNWLPLVVFAVVMLSSKLQRTSWPAGESTLWIVSISIYPLLLAWMSDWANQKVCSSAMLFGWGMTFGAGASLLVLVGRFQNYSNLAVVLAVCIGVLFLMSMIYKNYQPGFSVWMVLSLLFISLVIATTNPWYSYLPIWMGVILLVSPLSPLLVIPVAKNRWLSLLIVVLVTSAFLIWPGIDAYHEYMELREMGYAP